ncbi:hypothetical protein NBRC10513v2_007933 [Rhodotorula toruloides]
MHGLRHHSIASSTGSLTDDLALASSLASHDGGYAYGAHPDQSMRSSFSDIDPGSPYVGLSRSITPAVVHVPPSPTPSSSTTLPGALGGTGRTRARAFSFLSVAGQPAATSHSAPSPATGDTPFVGGAYDFALAADELDPSDDDEDDDEAGHEMRALGGGSSGPKMAAASLYRMRFQPLEAHELAWMAVSAAAVTGLTVAAAVLAFVG